MAIGLRTSIPDLPLTVTPGTIFSGGMSIA
jgi:hypothetical protein